MDAKIISTIVTEKVFRKDCDFTRIKKLPTAKIKPTSF